MNRIVRGARMSTLLGIAVAGVATLTGTTAAPGAETVPAGPVGSGVPVLPDWSSSGQNNHNTRYAAAERSIDAGNVGTLKPKWVFPTAGNVSATATIVNAVAYVP